MTKDDDNISKKQSYWPFNQEWGYLEAALLSKDLERTDWGYIYARNIVYLLLIIALILGFFDLWLVCILAILIIIDTVCDKKSQIVIWTNRLRYISIILLALAGLAFLISPFILSRV